MEAKSHHGKREAYVLEIRIDSFFNVCYLIHILLSLDAIHNLSIYLKKGGIP
jgi:hypothetical protein